MDSLDLLAREDEFKKLNKQLEKKTESLMKAIEQAMQKQDIFSEFSPSLTLSPVHTTKKHNCDPYRPPTPPTTQRPQRKKTKSPKYESKSPNSERSPKFENGTKNCAKIEYGVEKASAKFENRMQNSSKFEKGGGNSSASFENDINDGNFDDDDVQTVMRNRMVCDCCINKGHSDEKEFIYAFVNVNVKDKVLPQSFLKERPTVESVCKFLASKVKLMQEQIDKLQNTLEKKASQCESHLSELAELESERMSLLNKCNNMKSSTADMKAKCMALQHRLEEKEKLYIEQRSQSDKLSCEVKRLRTQHSSLQAKCATQQHTIEHLTQQLETVKRTEKEFRDSTRSLSASHQNAISRLEAQLKEQNSRIDKQMALIDNLRRQNVLLSTDAAVKGLEKEYCEYLQKDF